MTIIERIWKRPFPSSIMPALSVRHAAVNFSRLPRPSDGHFLTSGVARPTLPPPLSLCFRTHQMNLLPGEKIILHPHV